MMTSKEILSENKCTFILKLKYEKNELVQSRDSTSITIEVHQQAMYGHPDSIIMNVSTYFFVLR